MVIISKSLRVFFFIILSVFVLAFVSADWDFYGYVYDTSGNALYNATINVTIWSIGAGGPPSYVGSNVSYSNQTGWFNGTVTGNLNWLYKPIVQHFEQNKTDGSTPIDYIGQSLPMFPFFEFNGTTDINFYLREAGTINITAVNATGSTKTFQYVVKDTKLGYPIAEGFGNYVSQAIIYVPRDRNYTIQIYPNESMPVSYHWNNFSATEDYSFDYNSNYNATTHTLNKQFNVTENLIWVSGYALNTTGDANYDEFTVIPFILEAGNMVYLGEDAAMPYNMSAWRRNETDGSPLNLSDQYNLSSGFYNITLPGPAESVNYLLFATAKGTDGKYYGGYRNISLNYSSSDTQINFTLYPLMSTDWASANSNITMNDAANWVRGLIFLLQDKDLI